MFLICPAGKNLSKSLTTHKLRFSSSIIDPEYAFEMASSSVRFGRGVTKEIGHDLVAMGLTSKVCVVTDAKMATLPPMKSVLDSLTRLGVQYEVFDQVQVEPTDVSIQSAIKFCQSRNFNAFVAVGGGSVIDTAKAANLYMCYPNNDFLDFVNAPIGKGKPIPGPLKPLIAGSTN
jgi:hydroxyacid-oxoacid transhydrogenase